MTLNTQYCTNNNETQYKQKLAIINNQPAQR